MGDANPAEHPERIAVVFVHGQGQQRPMEDVQELARTMWDAAPGLKRKQPPDEEDGSDMGQSQPDERAWTQRYARSFTVPDERLEGADFARVTTEGGWYKTRIDFFEFYWADLMVGNRFDHLFSWFIELQRRPRREVPLSILPIRQFLIRFCESVLLLALLFAFCVALLLPPSPPTQWDHMQTFALGAWGVPPPVDQVWILGMAALLFIFAAWIRMIANEIVGGAAPVGGLPTLLARLMTWLRKQSHGAAGLARSPVHNIRVSAKWNAIRARVMLIAGLALFVLAVFLVVWQGPTLDWGDLRVALWTLVLIAAGIATFRRKHIIAATTIALVAAALGLVGALFGGIGGVNLFEFGNGATFDNFAETWGLPPGAGGLPFAEFDGGAEFLLLSLQTLQMFAGLWFMASFIKQASAQPRAFWRVILVVAAIGVSVWLAQLALSNKLIDPPFIWLVFALGSQLSVVVLVVALLFVAARKAFLLPVMADSARYLSRDPENIGARQEIRKRGLRLLEQLHKKDSGEAYQRIVVVAHSLGSVVAYELLMDFWSRQAGAYDLDGAQTPCAGGAAYERMKVVMTSGRKIAEISERLQRSPPRAERQELLEALKAARKEYRLAQFDLSNALAECKPDPDKGANLFNWRITDFITVGSPLTHASLLLAEGPKDLGEKKSGRSLSTCPPTPGDSDNGHTFKRSDDVVRPVHSAIFSAVRWTNIHFKAEPFILEGDVIGGAVGPMLGYGIEDVEVDRKDTGAVFAHNEYWRSKLETGELRKAFDDKNKDVGLAPTHLKALRKALALAGDDETLASLVKEEFRPGA